MLRVPSIVEQIRRRPNRVFAALVLAPALVVTALFGWQAVESQQVKNALTGGLDGGSLLVQGDVGTVVSYGTPMVNEGDARITLDDVGLLLPDDGIRLVDAWALAAEQGVAPVVEAAGPPAGALPLEGFALDPGQVAVVFVGVEVGREGDALGFDGLRVHYHAGGRAGETVARGQYAACAPSPSCDPAGESPS